MSRPSSLKTNHSGLGLSNVAGGVVVGDVDAPSTRDEKNLVTMRNEGQETNYVLSPAQTITMPRSKV